MVEWRNYTLREQQELHIQRTATPVAGVKRKPSCRRHGEKETERPDHVGPVDYCDGAISQGKGKQLEATTSKLWIEDDSGSDQSGSGGDGLQYPFMNTSSS